jgi:hypothetical protein
LRRKRFFLTAINDYRVPGLGNSNNVTDSTYLDWQNLGFDRNSIIADPGFIDLANGDFNLRTDSPALKLGFSQINFTQIGIRPR